MSTTEMSRAAAYVRCSTDQQDQSIPDQQKAILEYASEHDLVVVKWFTDEGKSGTRAENRPGFQELQDVVKNGDRDFSSLLVYDISRWGRFGDGDEAAHYEFTMKSNGVSVHYTNEGFVNDNSPGSQIIKSVSRTMAGEYSKKLAHLTIRGNQSNAAKGYYNGGPPPYGYRRMLCEPNGTPLYKLAPGDRKADKNQKVKLILGPPDEIEMVRRIYHLYVEQSHSAKSVARLLELERQKGGTPSPRGGAWTQSTVHGMLRNPVYCGRIVWGRRCYHHLIYPLEIGKHHDESEWVVCKDAHPGIITEETWEEAQKGAKRNAGFRRPRATSPYLLVGLIRCMRCGFNYQGQKRSATKKKPNEYAYYVCRSYQRYSRDGCISYSIPKEKIEKEVIDQIYERLRRSKAMDRIARQLQKQLARESLSLDDRLADLQSELQETEIKEQRLLKFVEIGELPPQTAGVQFKQLEADKDRLREEIAALEATEVTEIDPKDALKQIMAFLKNFRQILKEGTLDEQRTLIRCFVDRVEVDPDAPTVEVFMYKVPEFNLEELQELETVTS